MTTRNKVFTVGGIVIAVALALFVFFKFYFVLGEGVKAGELNQFVYKGWVWKTYEGKIIQTGFRGAKGGGSIQSNEFLFSVTDPEIKARLMRCSGKAVELAYKEYNGMLPWRGMQHYIVYDILSVSDTFAPVDKITEIPVEQ